MKNGIVLMLSLSLLYLLDVKMYNGEELYCVNTSLI